MSSASAFLADDSFYVLLASGAAIQGEFDNVKSGTRVTTQDGMASFVVNYGLKSDFPAHQLVISDLQVVPEPAGSVTLIIAGGAAIAGHRRRRRRLVSL